MEAESTLTQALPAPCFPAAAVKQGATLLDSKADAPHGSVGVTVVAWDPHNSGRLDEWHEGQERGSKLDAPAGGASTSYAGGAGNRSLRVQASMGAAAAFHGSKPHEDNGLAAAEAAAATAAALADLHDMQAQQRRATGRSATSKQSGGGAHRRSSGSIPGYLEDAMEGNQSIPSSHNMLSFMMPTGPSQRKSLDLTRSLQPAPRSHGLPHSSSRAASRRSMDLAALGQNRRRNSLDLSSAGNLGGGVSMAGHKEAAPGGGGGGGGGGARARRGSVDMGAVTRMFNGSQGPNHVPGLRGRRGSILGLGGFGPDGLKGMLAQGGRLLGSVVFRYGSAMGAEEEDGPAVIWFTGLEDFKPLCHQLHKGRFMSAFFACAHVNGKNYLLKKYDKRKMLPSEERGVRRMLAWYEELQHPGLVGCMGTWETEENIIIVEEYINKGDVLQHCISRPELYSEAYVANTVLRPLLEVLAYLHNQGVIHRSVLPENVYLDLEDKPRLGHMHTLIDARTERPKSRLGLLDYLAPEMFSVKLAGQAELEVLGAAPDSWHADQQMRDQKPNAWDPELAAMSPSIARGGAGQHSSSGGASTSTGGVGDAPRQLKRPMSPPAGVMLQSLQGRSQSPLGSAGGAPRSPRGTVRSPAPMGSAPSSPRGGTRVREPAVCLPNAAAGSEEDEEEEEGGIAADARSTFPETGSATGASMDGDSAVADEGGQDDEEDEDEEDLSPLQKRLLMKGGPTKKWRGKGAAGRDAAALSTLKEDRDSAEEHNTGEQQQQGKVKEEEEEQVPYERASWEQQDSYDQKVDIWQLGCLMHELLFGCLPFEDGDMIITAAHMLWSDLDDMPPCSFGPATVLGAPTLRLAPDGQAFLAAALTKDPAARPNAEQLLQHPWLERHAAGRPWIDPVKPKARDGQEHSMAGHAQGLLARMAAHAPGPLAALLTWAAGSSNRVAPDVASGVDAAGAAAGAAATGAQEGAAAAAAPGAAAPAAAAPTAPAGAVTVSVYSARGRFNGSIQAAASSTAPDLQEMEADASVAVGWGGKLAPKAPKVTEQSTTPRGRRAQAQLQLQEDEYDLPPSASGRYDGVVIDDDDFARSAPADEGPVQANGRYGGPGGLRLTAAVLRVHNAGPKAPRPLWEGMQT